jgi:type IV secretory pathway VirD2 relaxase
MTPSTTAPTAKASTERRAGDRHRFRFIVALEDSVEHADLKPFISYLMQMEQDLGTGLNLDCPAPRSASSLRTSKIR